MDRFSEIFNFDNVGSKIKNLVKWSCWISIILLWIGAIITFFIFISDSWLIYFIWIPLVAAIVGPFLIWLSSWLLYGFGQLIENSDITTKEIRAIRNHLRQDEARKQENKKQLCQDESGKQENKKQLCQDESGKQENKKDFRKPEKRCQLCDGLFDHLTICEIKDEYGVKYRKICDDCMLEHNAKKVKG